MVLQKGSIRRVRGLWPYALLATFGVVVIPFLVVVAAVALGLPEPQILFSTVLGLLLSFGIAAVATTMWLRRPESLDVAFGELILWRFFRRHRAEQTIEEGAETLGLGSEGWVRNLHLAPETQLEVLHDLTAALEAKDPYTHGHSRRVERHVYRTAMSLGLAPEAVEELRLSAALHDVGKIRIPERVLRKPGALDEAERRVVQEHSIIGAELVASAASPRVSQAVRHHHEYWDGAGYPDRLAGEDIPLFARIIAVSDAYDAMTSARPYQAGCNRKDAVEALRAGAGVQFDPMIVEAFITTLPSVLPAAGALLVFALPGEALRRVSAWAKSTASGSVATAAGTAGMAILVGTASIGGNNGLDRQVPHIARPAAIVDTYADPVVPLVATSKTPSRPADDGTRVLGSREQGAPSPRTVVAVAGPAIADEGPAEQSGGSGAGQGPGPGAPQDPGDPAHQGDNEPPEPNPPDPGPGPKEPNDPGPGDPGPPDPHPSENGNPPPPPPKDEGDDDDDEDEDEEDTNDTDSGSECKKGNGHHNGNPGKGHDKHGDDSSNCP